MEFYGDFTEPMHFMIYKDLYSRVRDLWLVAGPLPKYMLLCACSQLCDCAVVIYVFY